MIAEGASERHLGLVLRVEEEEGRASRTMLPRLDGLAGGIQKGCLVQEGSAEGDDASLAFRQTPGSRVAALASGNELRCRGDSRGRWKGCLHGTRSSSDTAILLQHSLK